MWLGPVDLPEALLEAQAQGTLVVFAGAGVSMGVPSSLPSFEQLVTRVATGARIERGTHEALDRFLGRLEGQRVDVQRRVRDILSDPASQPTSLHSDLLTLFGSADRVRVVTTNFDAHFGTAAAEQFSTPGPDVYVGPALPLGRDVRGIIHLHGALFARHPLVLTDGDFGRAYLTDGWARRFLVEMFQHFTVLFVGYSHNDPITGHLARSLPPGTARFALTEAGRDADWHHLGITPIEFPVTSGSEPYAALGDVIHRWGEHIRMGVFDHEHRIRALVSAPPPIDPESVDYLRVVLRDSTLARLFTDAASTVEWLDWLDRQGYLTTLFQREAPLAETERQLAWWVAERFAVTHAGTVLELVRRHNGVLHGVAVSAVLWTFRRHKGRVPSDVLGAWVATTLFGLPPTWSREELTDLLKQCTRRADVSAALLLTEHLTRPYLALEEPWRWGETMQDDDPPADALQAEDVPTSGAGGQGAAPGDLRRHGEQDDGPSPTNASERTAGDGTDVVDPRPDRAAASVAAHREQGPPHEDPRLTLHGRVTVAADPEGFREAWATVLRPRLAALHTELLAIIVTHLTTAHRLFRAIGDADRGSDPWSVGRSAIEPYEQDAYPDVADLLIDMARDVVEHIVEHAPARANALATEWRSSEVALLRRLAVHVAAQEATLDPDQVIARLVDERWLADYACKHEVFRLIGRAYPTASETSRRSLIEHSLAPGLWIRARPDDSDELDVPAPTAEEPAGVAGVEPEHDTEHQQLRAYEEYNLAVWLARQAPECPIAAAHLAAMHARNPKWEPREYPDLDSWSSGAFSRGLSSPRTAEALLEEPPAAQLEFLRTFTGVSDPLGDAPDRAGLMSAVHEAAHQSPRWGLELADGLQRAAAQEWDLWEALLSAWTAADLTADQWHAVLTTLDTVPDLLDAVPRMVADLLKRGVEQADRGVAADDLSLVERLADRAFTAAASIPPIERRSESSWIALANAHPAGRIAEVWLHALSRRMRDAGGTRSDAWSGMPVDYQQRFARVITDSSLPAQLATVVVASGTRFLLTLDRPWVIAHVLPLFDWERDAERAEQVFHGFIERGALDDVLWESLRSHFVAAFSRMPALAPVRRRLAYDLAWAAIYGSAHPLDDGWLTRFVANADAETRLEWARIVGRTLRRLDAAVGAALWTRWIDKYWADRLTGIPRPFDAAEANTMIEWALGLPAVFPAAVERLRASPFATDERGLAFYHLEKHEALIAQHPNAVVDLLLALLSGRTQPFYDCEHVTNAMRAATRAGADRRRLLVLGEQLARLACPEATSIRHELDGGQAAD